MTLLVVWRYSPVADRNVPPLCLAYHIIHTPAPLQSLGYSCLSGSPFISHRNVQVFPSPPTLTLFCTRKHTKYGALTSVLSFCALPFSPGAWFATQLSMAHPLGSQASGAQKVRYMAVPLHQDRAKIILGPAPVTCGLCSSGPLQCYLLLADFPGAARREGLQLVC